MNLADLQKVKRNGQITIPKEFRERFKLKDGDFIRAECTPEGIVIRVVDVEVRERELRHA